MNLISIGDHCAIPLVLKELGLRTKSYPFDWVTCIDHLHDTNIIYNIKILQELTGENEKYITDKYINNALNNDNKTNERMWFPHEQGDTDDVLKKYHRRFNRLYVDLKLGGNICIMLTRHYYIDEESFDEILKVILGYNSTNTILFISGTDHPYLENKKNVIFKYIYYDITQFYGYDYSNFRPNVKSYLKNHFNKL